MRRRSPRRTIPWTVLIEPVVVALAAVALLIGAGASEPPTPAGDRPIEVEARDDTPALGGASGASGAPSIPPLRTGGGDG